MISETSMPNKGLQFDRRTVVKNILALFSSSIVAQGITAITTLLIARQLGAEEYGKFAGSIALVSFTAIFFRLGLDTWLMRWGGREPELLSVSVSSVLIIRGGIGFLWLVGWWAISGLVHLPQFPVALLRVSALVVWFDNLLLTCLTAFKASLKNVFTLLIDGASDAIWLGLTLWLIFLGINSPLPFMIVKGGSLFFMVLIAVFTVSIVIRFSFSKKMIIRVFREAFPFATSDFFAWVAARVDVLIVTFILGEYAVGLYSPAVGITNVLLFIPGALHGVFFPVLSNLFKTDEDQAWKTTARSMVLQFGVGIWLSVGLYFGAAPIVKVLGETYAASIEVLKILSLVLLLHSISFGLAPVIVAADEQGKRTIVQGVSILANVIANMLLLPKLGIIAAGWNYIASEIVLTTGYLILVLNIYSKRRSRL